MPTLSIPLNSRINTSSEPVTLGVDSPTFRVKNSIAYNNTIRNAFITEGKGTVLTSGENLAYSSYKDPDTLEELGAIATSENGKVEYLPYKWLLSETETIEQAAAGTIVNSVLFEDVIYTLYDNQDTWTIVQTTKDNQYIGQKAFVREVSSVIISSIFQVESKPILITLTTEEVSGGSYTNIIQLYYINDLDNPIFTYQVPGFIPLGDLHSSTIRLLDDYETLIVGCDDIDKNRSLTMFFRLIDGVWSFSRSYKWFGCVSPRGDITGEPIPNPAQYPTSYSPTRRDNGTYLWDTYLDNKARAWDLIGGYYINPFTGAIEPIIIAEPLATQYCHVNLSENDTDTSEAGYDPKRYLVTNFAEAKSVYYDYGIGWVKSYARIVERSANNIVDLYIKTFGAKQLNSTFYRTESMIFNQKGVKPKLDFDAGKLNQRVYGIGGTNKATSSVLATLPFTVELIPAISSSGDERQMLDMQVYGLQPLSFSFNKSLLTTGSNENLDNNRPLVIYTKDTKFVFLSFASQWYVIENTSDYQKLSVDKVADYFFRTNILDNKNLIIEDRGGNISIKNSFIPYHMECILDTDNGDIDPPTKDIADPNNAWFWAAGYNANVLTSAVIGVQAIDSCSYLLPSINLPLYISPAQSEAFTEATLENRGSILKPIITNLFDDYQEVDLYYTLQTSGSLLTYRSSAVIKQTDTDRDYLLYGKDTFNIDKSSFYWAVSASQWLFPIGIASVINGVNYIQPTVEVSQNYVSRLYKPYNKVYLMFNYVEQLLYGNTIFTIYGNNYYYDGQGIYFTGSNNQFSAVNQFVCYALGMQFLSNSGSEAYFYSDFEKKIFIFTGSNVLQPADSMSNRGNIIDSVFSSKEQLLYLLTDEDEIIIRSITDTALLDNVPVNARLEATAKGCAVVNGDDYFIYNPHTGKDTRPFHLETEYMGKNDGLAQCSYVDFILYNLTDSKQTTYTIEFSTLNGIEEKLEKKTETIGAKDWKGSTYRLRFTPRANVGNGFKVALKSDDLIAVSYLGFDFKDASATGSAPRK